MARRPTILSTLTPVERAAWTLILAFAQERAAAIAIAGWREDVTDLVLSEILSAPHLRAAYLLAIGATDPHVRGNRRKRVLDQQIGKTCRAASGGGVRILGGKRVMRDASSGPHFRFTVLDPPPSGPFAPPPGP